VSFGPPCVGDQPRGNTWLRGKGKSLCVISDFFVLAADYGSGRARRSASCQAKKPGGQVVIVVEVET
jgi:hypothetical protein